ncbi:MAG: YebC/PmpR family DNA-binding transcriptional regulator [Elusimicrobia bacterium]|jgi:YebC/PmpR family DNA-binding regulatory protein|nr:YebC/PmpR family DNA-binding transcriptional regulator [Elusimicrobiota bacterium]
MSGHSRWAGIKHKKGALDAKKGKVFTRIVRELTIAARTGGGLPENNPRLRKAIEDGRAANMPFDNVKKAIQRGTGEIPGMTFEEVSYEGYGPGGAAVFFTGTTDNRNRTSSEIRKVFSSHGGNLGESGCVAWMFQSKGQLIIEKSVWQDEDKLMTVALEAGAEDIKSDDPEIFQVLTAPADFEKVKAALEAAGVPLNSSEITLLPSTTVTLKDGAARQMEGLMEELENHDDVKDVYTNGDIEAGGEG